MPEKDFATRLLKALDKAIDLGEHLIDVGTEAYTEAKKKVETEKVASDDPRRSEMFCGDRERVPHPSHDWEGAKMRRCPGFDPYKNPTADKRTMQAVVDDWLLDKMITENQRTAILDVLYK